MRFYEVHAKSALNRVPAASRMPFRWTINPYRGCSHACVYCLAGDTPILMADRSHKPLAKLRVGDEIYGTELRGKYRRYVRTRVLAHWASIKPAHRVTLEDGTELIASANHQFLTDGGWLHVTGAEEGTRVRPHLTTANSLLGTGGFAAGPEHSVHYELGYLCGMIRGGDNLASHAYDRPGGPSQPGTPRFRLALVDGEALYRTQRFLLAHGVHTTSLPFDTGSRTTPIHVIGAQSQSQGERIGELVALAARPERRVAQGLPRGDLRRGGVRWPRHPHQQRRRDGPALDRDVHGCVRVPDGTRRSERDGHQRRAPVGRAARAAALLSPRRPGDPPQARHRRHGGEVQRTHGRGSRSSRSERRCASTTSRPERATSSPTASSATTASRGRRTRTWTSTPAATSSARSS